jgi:hypothetical protein
MNHNGVLAMKKILFILTFVLAGSFENLSAQNGTTIISMPGFFNPLTLRYKNCMVVDNNGKNWIGTRDVGLLGWDGISWTYFDATYGLTDNNVKCLCQDPNGLLWVGTDTGGVCVFNGATWGNFSAWNSPCPSNKIFSLAKNGNDLWVGTNRGLAKYDGTNWTIFNTQNSGIPSDTINKIDFSSSGEILAATSRGLIRFNGTNWSGLWTGPTLNVDMIYVDSNGAEWNVCNGELWKKTGATYTQASVIFNLSQIHFTGIKCLGKGPSGGVAFTPAMGQLNEISGTRIKTYYPFATMVHITNGNAIFSASQNGNYFSYCNSFSMGTPYFDLMEFNAGNYNGLGKGFTGDNAKFLDVNNVNARILDRGDLHWDLLKASYETPKGSGISSVYCSNLWMGGLDAGGNIHEAAMTYRQNGMDFFPGPLDEQTGLIDSTISYKFDRLWKTDRYEISEFQFQFAQGNVQNGNFVPSNDILDWPAIGNFGITQPLAPFVDVNGNGIYDPLIGGDYPKITGDQEIYWVFNDALASHSESGGLPIGVEVQAHAYSFACPGVSDSDRAINYTTFYNFDIINRTATDYHNVSLGLFQDIDLGSWNDDFIGCLPQDNFSFAYNGEANDSGSGVPEYRHFPPTQATTILNGPLAVPNDSIDNNNNGTIDEPGEKNLMTGFIFFHFNFTNPSMRSPSESTDYYGYLNDQWKDSTDLTFGGNGYGGITPTKFLYPSLPDDTLGWNEFSTGNIPGDRTHLTSTGPCNFLHGDTIHYTFALVTSFDSIDAWNSHGYYMNMLHDVQNVQQWYANSSIPSCFPLFDHVSEPIQNFSSLQLYPNPANDRLNIIYNAKNKNAVLEIYDISGKRIFAGMWNDIPSMNLSVENYVSGIYFVRMTDGDTIISQKFIKE